MTNCEWLLIARDHGTAYVYFWNRRRKNTRVEGGRIVAVAAAAVAELSARHRATCLIAVSFRETLIILSIAVQASTRV